MAQTLLRDVDNAALRDAIEALLEKERRVAQLELAAGGGLPARAVSLPERGQPAPVSLPKSAREIATAGSLHELGRTPSAGAFKAPVDASAILSSARSQTFDLFRLTANCAVHSAEYEGVVPWALPSSAVLRASGLPLPPLHSLALRDGRLGKTGLSIAGLVEGEEAIGSAKVHDLLQELPASVTAVATRKQLEVVVPSAARSGGAATAAPTAAAAPVPPVSDAPVTLLDVSWNGLGPRCAGALVDVLWRFRGVHSLHLVGNPLGGTAGTAVLLRACSLLPNLRHLGVSLLDGVGNALLSGTAEGFGVGGAAGSSGDAARPERRPATAGSAAAVSRGRPARGASVGRATAASGAGASAAGGSDADATGGDFGPAEAGTVWHLAAVLRAGALRLSSVSIAGSSLSRKSLATLLAACAPTLQSSPAGTAAALGAAAPASSGSRGTAPAPAGTAAVKGGRGGGRVGAAVPPSALPAATAAGAGAPTSTASRGVVALDLSRTVLSALTALDLSLALAPSLPPGNSARAGASPPSPASGPLAGMDLRSTAIITALASEEEPPISGVGPAAAAGGPSRIAARLTALSRLPGALTQLRYLNLTQCSLSTAGIRPLLEVVAASAQCLAVLILRGNHIDDDGAGLLAEAIRLNAHRLEPAHAADVGLTDDAFSSGAMLTATRSPLRVLDVRNNPLYASSGSDGQHPGCTALAAALADTPSLLTLSGPEPTLEGLAMWIAGDTALAAPTVVASSSALPAGSRVPWDAASTGVVGSAPQQLHAVANTWCASIFGPQSGIGWGPQCPIDLCAVQGAAQRVLAGAVGFGGGSSSAASASSASALQSLGDAPGRADAEASLDLPHGMAHAVARVTLGRVADLVQGASEACQAAAASRAQTGGLAADVAALLNSVTSVRVRGTGCPVVATVANAAVALVPATRLMRSLRSAMGAPVSQLLFSELGTAIASLPLPASGLAGCRAQLEWHGAHAMRCSSRIAGVALPRSLVAEAATACKLVWTVVACSGPSDGLSGCVAADGSAYSIQHGRVLAVRSQHATASRDRAHARERGSLADAALCAPSDSASDATDAALSFLCSGQHRDSGTPSDAASPALAALASADTAADGSSWLSAAGLHAPAVIAAPATPPGAGIDGEWFARWPSAWQSVDVTALLASGGLSGQDAVCAGARLVLFARVVEGPSIGGAAASTSERLAGIGGSFSSQLQLAEAAVQLSAVEVVQVGDAADSSVWATPGFPGRGTAMASEPAADPMLADIMATLAF